MSKRMNVVLLIENLVILQYLSKTFCFLKYIPIFISILFCVDTAAFLNTVFHWMFMLNHHIVLVVWYSMGVAELCMARYTWQIYGYYLLSTGKNIFSADLHGLLFENCLNQAKFLQSQNKAILFVFISPNVYEILWHFYVLKCHTEIGNISCIWLPRVADCNVDNICV